MRQIFSGKKNRERGSATIEAVISFTGFIFVIVTLLSVINFCRVQMLISNAVDTVAKEMAQYSYFYEMSGLQKFEDEIKSNADTGASKLNSVVATVDDLYVTVGSAVSDNVQRTTDLQNAALEGTIDVNQIGIALQNAETDITKIKTASQVMQNQFGEVMDNPMTFVKGIVAVAGNQSLQMAKSYAIAAPLSKALFAKHFGSTMAEADQKLEELGVIGGLNGMNFNMSTIFSEKEPNAVHIVVYYEIRIARLFDFAGFNATLCKESVAQAWLGGDDVQARVAPKAYVATVPPAAGGGGGAPGAGEEGAAPDAGEEESDSQDEEEDSEEAVVVVPPADEAEENARIAKLEELGISEGRIPTLVMSPYYEDILVAIEHNADYKTDVVAQINQYGTDALTLITKYGSDAVVIIGAYGADGISLLRENVDDVKDLVMAYDDLLVQWHKQYGQQLIEWYHAHGETALEILLLYGDSGAKYLEEDRIAKLRELGIIEDQIVYVVQDPYYDDLLAALNVTKGYNADIIAQTNTYGTTAIELIDKYGDCAVVTIGLYEADGIALLQSNVADIKQLIMEYDNLLVRWHKEYKEQLFTWYAEYGESVLEVLLLYDEEAVAYLEAGRTPEEIMIAFPLFERAEDTASQDAINVMKSWKMNFSSDEIERINEIMKKRMGGRTSEEIIELYNYRVNTSKISNPNEHTLMSKVLNADAAKNYLNNIGYKDTVYGFIAKACDCRNLSTAQDYVNTFGLNYVESNGNTPFIGVDSIQVIRFKTNDTENIDIPFGGNNTIDKKKFLSVIEQEKDNQAIQTSDIPFDGSGFTQKGDNTPSGVSGEVGAPEFYAFEAVKINAEAAIFDINLEGEEYLLAVYKDSVWYPTLYADDWLKKSENKEDK